LIDETSNRHLATLIVGPNLTWQ